MSEEQKVTEEQNVTENKNIQNLKESILKEYDRLGLEDKFTFGCHPGVSCFNQCCSDVNIFLTPYDILRLKNRLGITSWEFLDKYTIQPIDKNLQYPVILMKMRETEAVSCHFVEEGGCTVYEDRPWACRMYPLGLASPPKDGAGNDHDFYFLLHEEVCQGFKENKTEFTVKGWMENQGVPEYDEFGRLFKEITLHPYLQRGKAFDPSKMEMFHMVCYNLDKFRGFLFNTSFLDRFVVDDRLKEKMKTDDGELLKFGFQWLKFALYGEKTMAINAEAQKKVFDQKQE